MKAALLLAIGAAALSACVNYGLVPPERTTVRSVFSVEPGIAWNRRRELMLIEDEIVPDNPAIEVWTQDGTAVDQLVFYAGIEEGQALMRGRIARSMPRFQKSMSGLEVAELFEAALVAGLRASEVELVQLAPTRFAGGPGFRFRVGFLLDDEVERDATAVGTVREGKLYMIAWVGTRLYHHDRYLPEFEKIAASAQITQ